MPLYFFDFQVGDQSTPDVEGTEMNTREAARNAAIAMLPEIATSVLPDGERRCFKVAVREDDKPIFYRATLIFHGAWLP